MPAKRNTELRNTIRALIREDATRSLQEIADRSGVTKARVQQLVKELGYEFRVKSSWRLARRTRPKLVTQTSQEPDTASDNGDGS